MTIPLREGVGDTAGVGPGPTSARQILDNLESQVGPLPADDGTGLHGDVVDDVPGSSEPPD